MGNLKPPSINFEYEGEVIEEPQGKTGREWILESSLLSTEAKVSALAYLTKSRLIDSSFNSLSRCLNQGFTWSETKEGHGFWSEINYKARRQELNL